jgi:hypothetical protein
MAPVELIGLAGRIVERHVGLGRHRTTALGLGLGISANGVVTAVITK